MGFEKGNKQGNRFKKGETGNPNGRPPKLPQLDELLAKVMGEEQQGMTAAEAILKKLRHEAAKGNIRAAEILLDRAYGKPTQRTELTGAEGEPLNVSPVQIQIEYRKEDGEATTD